MRIAHLLLPLSSSAALTLFAATTSLAQPPRTWVPLDTQPPGTPAQLVLDRANSDPNITRGSLTISGFWLVPRLAPDGTPYNDVQVPGLPNLEQTGAPRLPAVQIDVGILTGAQQVSLVQATGAAVYFHGVHVWPQPIGAQFHEGTPETFARDPVIYGSQSFWPPQPSSFPTAPATLAGLLPYAQVVVNPFHWNPGVDDMEVHPRYDFTLAHRGALTPINGLPATMARYLGNSVFNGSALTGSMIPDPIHYTGYFLFVTPSARLADIDPIVMQKKARGFFVTVLTTEQIGFGCPATLAAIKAWYHGTPAKADHYCILVGDHADIPLCTSPPVNGWPGGVPTDDSYGDPDNPVSLDKEILVGRLAGSTSSEIASEVQRILAYEDTPPLFAPYQVVVLAAHKDNIGATPIDSWQEDVRTAGYAVSPTFQTQYGANAGVNDASLSTHVNSGAGLVCYLGHGDTYEWWNWDLPGEMYGSPSVFTLANGPRCPVVWSFACQTCDLTAPGTCLGEDWMIDAGNGGVSFYGGTRNVYVDPTVDLDKDMFDEVYNKSNLIQGYTDLAGEQRMETVHHSGDAWKYTLLGDPQMSIRREMPIALVVSVPTLVTIACPTGPCVALHLSVSDPSGRPLPGAKVGIWKPGPPLPGLARRAEPLASAAATDEVLDDRYTDASGAVDIPVPPLTDGPFYYSVESDGGQAALGTAHIIQGNVGVSPTGPRSFHLLAAPSLLRSGTRFEFGSPLERAAHVDVFDVVGRRVRTLSAEAGARDLAWAGDDDAGRRLSPGLYLARLDAGRELGRCRLVVP